MPGYTPLLEVFMNGNGRETEATGQLHVLVTGGLGFVGSEICHVLSRKSHVNLFVIDNESKGSRRNVAGLPLRCVKADIRDRDAIENAFAEIKPEVVIHLAAMHFIPDCNRDPSQCMQVNVVGTENVLSACRKSNVKRVVVTSSMAIYPIKDEANFEDDPAIPYDVYGESKLVNEFQARRFQRETGIDTIAVRLSNVYGPRETNPHVIPEIMEQLKSGNTNIELGNIEPMRDFIHTKDAAGGFVALALNPLKSGFHIVNLGSGKEYSIKKIIQTISMILGCPVRSIRDESRYRDTERMHLLTDITRIKNLTGWSPSVDIREGLKDLCRWYGVI